MCVDERERAQSGMRRRIHACYMRRMRRRRIHACALMTDSAHKARKRPGGQDNSRSEEDACMSYEEEDTCMSYENRIHACHMRRRIHAYHIDHI